MLGFIHSFRWLQDRIDILKRMRFTGPATALAKYEAQRLETVPRILEITMNGRLLRLLGYKGSLTDDNAIVDHFFEFLSKRNRDESIEKISDSFMHDFLWGAMMDE